ncbi:MAG: molecular chaperone DnaK [Archaeoglobaceae archaeon]
MSKLIGIDLGTTNSEACVLEGGEPKMLSSAEGSKYFPSVVAFTEDGMVVGEHAKRQAVLNPEKTIFEIKRKMGTDYTVKIDDKEYTPEQISAFILQKIKRDAEDYLNDTVDQAVITVPAYFDDNQRRATRDAGQIAGLEVLRIINEPTAASLAYQMDKEEEATIAVFDFGGGTFDITILEVGDGVFEVKATNGDTQLGGGDIDRTLVNHFLNRFKEDTGIDLSQNREAMQRLTEAAEKAKIELSTMKKTNINLPFIYADDSGPKHMNYDLTRAKMEELVRPVIEKVREPCESCIKDAGVSKQDIDHVILVGGSTRMPMMREIVKDIFGKESERGVDPMECVAAGAAIQAGVISGEVTDILLLDVTPLTLSVETAGGVATPLIERNTTIPTKITKTFTTAADNQTAVTINVLQGERPMAKDNVSLGQFNLEGIPPAPRGVPQIDVTFDIDANGILNVNAKDKGTGKENHITITGSTRLSQDDIDKMVKEAKEHEEEDKRKKEEIETRNEADSLVYTTEKMLDDYKDQISQDVHDRIKEKVDALKKALEGEDIEEIKKKQEELSNEVQEIGKQMYEQAAQAQAQAGQQAGQTGQQGGSGSGGTYDADYEVKK